VAARPKTDIRLSDGETRMIMPSRGYLVCCIERTGSNLLAEALAGTGVAGRPLEYFNPVEQNSDWMKKIFAGSNLVEGFPKVLIAGTTPNGVFGAKVHWSHFRHLGMLISGEWCEQQRIALYDLVRSKLPTLLSKEQVDELLCPRFGELREHIEAYNFIRSSLRDLSFIWLRRRNKVARAISHFRAKQTGAWYQSSLSAAPDSGKRVYEYDLAEIHTLYCIGGFQEDMWQRFFEMHNISPRVVIYEDLATNYESVVRGVLDFLRIEHSAVAIPQPAGLKQSDALSAVWEQRYRAWNVKAEL
jgi:trehalose 2-sulfotransferase